MNVHLASLGCARNQIDSEVMLARLKRIGALIVDNPAEAEVIIVNTCSFIEAAADESIDTILELAGHKRTDRCRKLIVTGCLPERYRKDLVEALPEVDVFLGTGAFDRIVDAVDGYLDSAKCLLPDPDTVATAGDHPLRVPSNAHMAYLKIAEGCNRKCTYCIIPRLRGRQKSRPPADIVAEARQLLRAGVRELVLVSQETTAYGHDLEPPADFAELLAALATAAGNRHAAEEEFWIRFLYGHPESLSERTIAVVAGHQNICRYFDLPIQHASPSVLKKMGRRYGPDELYALVDLIRRALPDAALRTSVIVGFPGETEADFRELLAFIEAVRFEHLGCFIYSDAEDLPSHSLADPVPSSKAKERYRRLMQRQQEISAAANRRYRGRLVRVLVEERTEAGLYAGRTAFQAPEVDGVTYIRADRLQTGRFTDVRITDTLEYDLVGEKV